MRPMGDGALHYLSQARDCGDRPSTTLEGESVGTQVAIEYTIFRGAASLIMCFLNERDKFRLPCPNS